MRGYGKTTFTIDGDDPFTKGSIHLQPSNQAIWELIRVRFTLQDFQESGVWKTHRQTDRCSLFRLENQIMAGSTLSYWQSSNKKVVIVAGQGKREGVGVGNRQTEFKFEARSIHALKTDILDGYRRRGEKQAAPHQESAEEKS